MKSYLVAMAEKMGYTSRVEIAQTVANLTESSTNLYELIKGKNLRVYPDVDLRLAVSRAGARKTFLMPDYRDCHRRY